MLRNLSFSLALLFLCAPAQAQRDMVVGSFRDFSGGYVDNIPPTALRPNQSPQVFDAIIDEPPGALKSRKGFTLCGNVPSGAPATGLFEYFKTNGSRRLIVTDNQNYYETADCQTFTLIKDSLQATSNPDFATIRDKLWVVNGTTHTFTWTGSTTSILDGRSGTPSPPPPRGRYIQFWKERVWIARTDSDPSGVQFSDITDSNGIAIDPSTGTASWPAINLIQIDEGGGSPIYGMFVYRDRLHFCKDNGIWRLEFENKFNLAVIKTDASVGCRFNTAISQIDSLVQYTGKDGVYVFNGDESLRISDPWFNLFKTFNQPIANEQFKSWTSASDFEDGDISVQVDTFTITASLLLGTTFQARSDFEEPTEQVYGVGETFNSNGSLWGVLIGTWDILNGELEGGSGGSGVHTITTAINEPDFEQQIGRRYSIDIKHVIGGAGNTTEFWFLTQSTSTSDATTTGYRLTYNSVNILRVEKVTDGSASTILEMASQYPAGGVFHTFDIDLTSTGIISVDIDSVFKASTTDVSFSSSVGVRLTVNYNNGGEEFFDNFKDRIIFSTSQWRSDIFDAVSVSTWSTYAATIQSNGLDVSFFVRIGSNTGAVQSKSFVSIIPGAVISGTTAETFVQVEVKTTATEMKFAKLDDITVTYFQGGAPGQRIFHGVHDNRLYISASTGIATTNNIVIVRSRTPDSTGDLSKLPFQPIVPYRMQIGPLVKFNDLFYGGASTHSAIYRLDVGNNDNGAPIEVYWESRDEMYNTPYHKKNLMQIGVDFRRTTADNIQVAYSEDSGRTWKSKSLNTIGNDRRGTKIFFITGSNALTQRFRILNLEIDKPIEIYGVEGFAIPQKVKAR